MDDGVIAVLTPSRERPEQLLDMLDAIADTTDTLVHVYVGLDDDDESEYEQSLGWLHDGNVWVNQIRGPRAQLAEWTNRLALMALTDGHEILASFGDDHRPRTAGWDTAVQAAMLDMGPGLVYTKDGLQDERLPTAPFWHRSIIEAFGWYFPPVLKHLYADNWWLAAANALGRRCYLPKLLVEHLHPTAPNGNPEDAVNRANDLWDDEDRNAFHDFLKSTEHHEAIARARAVL